MFSCACAAAQHGHGRETPSRCRLWAIAASAILAYGHAVAAVTAPPLPLCRSLSVGVRTPRRTFCARMPDAQSAAWGELAASFMGGSGCGWQVFLVARGGRRRAELRGPVDRWKNPETGEPVISCTIIVTDANALTRPIHDRMPEVLDKADIRPWLSGEAGTEILKPAAEDRLRMWPVSRWVSKTGTGDDDPTLLATRLEIADR
jgi:hypothetical protein